jgi:hypothetical protein
MTKSRIHSEFASHSMRLVFGFAIFAGACANEGPPARSPDSAPAAEAESSAPETTRDVRLPGGASVFVVHDIKDFEVFRKYFEGGEAERQAAGVLGYLLSRLDDGRIVVHFFAKDVKEVEAALNSPKMQEYLSRDGAPDASLVWVTVDERVKIPKLPPQGKTYSLFFRLKTPDVAAFEKAFDARSAVFAEQGVIGAGLHESTSQAGMIVLHFMGTDREKLAALPARPEFVELLSLAGGAAAAKPLLGEDLARSRPK